MAEKLHLVVEEKAARARSILEGLQNAGNYEISIVDYTVGLSRKFAGLEPDIVLIALDNPSRNMLEELTAPRDC